MAVTALSVPSLTCLAQEINDAHREVKRHAKGMLLEAKRAGEALLKAKADCPHGTFKTWVEDNTEVSYRTAAVYMKVAREWDQKCSTLHISDPSQFSLRDFLDNKAKPQAAPTFTKDDAEYALKLHALVERGEGGEAEVAATKLNSFAKQFGMTGEEIVQKATEKKPEQTFESGQVDGFLREHFGKLTKQQLIEVIAYCMAEHPDLISKIIKKD